MKTLVVFCVIQDMFVKGWHIHLCICLKKPVTNYDICVEFLLDFRGSFQENQYKKTFFNQK